MKNFLLIGAAGFVASRHMRAIRDTGNNLIAALDPNDSVGIIDSHFPDAAFFTEFERFDRYASKLKREGVAIDYVSVCTPNYLHDAHIRFGLRIGADVICEKPLVLNPWNLDALADIEEESGKRINTILQLRLHPVIQELKQKVENAAPGKVFDVDLTYITSRGNWYYTSWKGNKEKSGGIATNIGIHFFDMLQWVFGDVKENVVHLHTHDRAAGYIEMEKARVRWFLSINYDTIPEAIKITGARTFRSITVDGEEVEFSEGFTDLHTLSYRSALEGNGYGLFDSAAAIQMAYDIRNAQPVGIDEDSHPLVTLPLSPHPFEREGLVESYY
ncbi:MAG: Gfo/Idh/MocA family oxidoreductase [Saprospiraceae bacterium]|nr:Gfo/Idh/MocA family oxidoreductase [Saprospiraceae bacterium]